MPPEDDYTPDELIVKYPIFISAPVTDGGKSCKIKNCPYKKMSSPDIGIVEGKPEDDPEEGDEEIVLD